MKRSTKTGTSAHRALNKKVKDAGRKAAPRHRDRIDSHGESAAAGGFGVSMEKILGLQRKILSAGGAAARTAVNNSATKMVKDGVADSFEVGIRKLERVFDERVAAALHRIGMPSAAELRLVCDTVEANAVALRKSNKRPRHKTT